MKYYILLDESDNSNYAIVGAIGFAPKNAICEAPKDENGEYIKDPAVIRIDDIQPMQDREKQAVDANGDPLFETKQRQTYDLQGNPILDVNGDPVMEDYQAPVIELDGQGNPVMESIPFGASYKQASVDAALEASRAAEKASNEEVGKWSKLRSERDKLLTESDFSQLADAPLTAEQKTAWRQYRGALRDLPANTANPDAPSWPVKPS